MTPFLTASPNRTHKTKPSILKMSLHLSHAIIFLQWTTISFFFSIKFYQLCKNIRETKDRERKQQILAPSFQLRNRWLNEVLRIYVDALYLSRRQTAGVAKATLRICWRREDSVDAWRRSAELISGSLKLSFYLNRARPGVCPPQSLISHRRRRL